MFGSFQTIEGDGVTFQSTAPLPFRSFNLRLPTDCQEVVASPFRSPCPLNHPLSTAHSLIHWWTYNGKKIVPLIFRSWWFFWKTNENIFNKLCKVPHISKESFGLGDNQLGSSPHYQSWSSERKPSVGYLVHAKLSLPRKVPNNRSIKRFWGHHTTHFRNTSISSHLWIGNVACKHKGRHLLWWVPPTGSYYNHLLFWDLLKQWAHASRQCHEEQTATMSLPCGKSVSFNHRNTPISRCPQRE